MASSFTIALRELLHLMDMVSYHDFTMFNDCFQQSLHDHNILATYLIIQCHNAVMSYLLYLPFFM